MRPDDASRQLREQGIVLLKGIFAAASLVRLNEAAARCFGAIATGRSLPDHYQFSQSSHSVNIKALSDFGLDDAEELVAPLCAPGLEPLLSEAMGCKWICNVEQAWLRKKFAPHLAPSARYHIQDWHQDGALGVRFPIEPGPAIPMTELLTCWIPLNACGMDSPGLEFIRCRQAGLLHFTELNDATLGARFSAKYFWAPELALGDGLVFRNDILHRTYVRPDMQHNRLSVEYRIFCQETGFNQS
jgi:hypothetical protein